MLFRSHIKYKLSDIAPYHRHRRSIRAVSYTHLNKIAFDLREAHKNDFFSVPEDNPLEDFLQTAEETAREDSDPEQAAMAFICKRLKLNYGKPVSYTHLDVYKRQDILFHQTYPLFSVNRCLGGGLHRFVKPVSYTHLDVYKRQTLYRRMNNPA